MVNNAQLNSIVESLRKLVDALATRVDKLESENKALREAQVKTPTLPLPPPPSTQTASTWASRLFNSRSMPSEELQNVVSAAKIEMSEKRQRQNNIMVFGLTPSKAANEVERERDDFARVEIILNKCGLQEVYQEWREDDPRIVSVKRVKSKQSQDDRPEPIVVKLDGKYETESVEFQDGRHVRKVLSGAKRLKDSEWKGVFLAPDLTTLEREYGKRLRAERDRLNSALSEQTLAHYRYGVRGSQVVKILAKSP
jgi:hypothetical protein